MRNAPLADAQAFLLETADKSPDRIIDLYTGQDSGLQLLLLDAKEKNIIRKVNGWFMYGDTNLGATDEAIIMYLKTPMNKLVLNALKRHVYPEFATQLDSQTENIVEEPEVNPTTKGKKGTK
jgi:hypothetical protein